MDALGYADDVMLITPFSLKSLLKVCDEFGSEFKVVFNADKYQLLHYSSSPGNNFQGIIYHKKLRKVDKICQYCDHNA